MGMEIAVTGGNGRVGRALIQHLVSCGHTVRSLDRADPPDGQAHPAEVRSISIDLNDLGALTGALRGSDAVVHMAAFPGLQGQPPGVVYANNTLISYNILYATCDLGIRKVCLASSVNAVGGLGSKTGHFDYFPVDERHPTYNEDDYSLSKWVLEQQADSFGRRAPEMTISSMRFHGLPATPPTLANTLDTADAPVARTLWGWTMMHEAARACELAVRASFKGHEAFFIIAPTTVSSIPSLDLARHAYPKVPIRGSLSGRTGFFDCSKAERLLGWVHMTPETTKG